MDRNTRNKVCIISLMLVLIAASTSLGVFAEREFNPEDNLLGILLIVLSGVTGVSAVALGIWAASLCLGRPAMLALGQQDHENEIEMQGVHKAIESPRDKPNSLRDRLVQPIWEMISAAHRIKLDRPVNVKGEPYPDEYLDDVVTVVACDYARSNLG